MLYIVNGIPGAGKSYLMIHLLTTLYCEKVKGTDIWQIKKHKDNTLPENEWKPYTIISNIEGLELPHLKLDYVIKQSGLRVTDFFKEPYQAKVALKHPNIVYIIDECQRYFDHKMHDTDTLYFFEHHRHLGMDIYLIAQTYKRINQYIRGLEFKRYQACSRIRSIFGEFRYDILADNEKMDTKVVRRNKELFKLYKSRERNEVSKPKNPIIKYFWLAGIGILFSGYMFYHTFLDTTKYQEKNVKKNVDTFKNSMNNNEKTIEKPIMNVKSNKGNNQQKIYYDDGIKYYYTLQTACVYHKYSKEPECQFMDFINNMMLPISIIKDPIIKKKRFNSYEYIVVSNYPNPRYIPIKENNHDNETDDEDR